MKRLALVLGLVALSAHPVVAQDQTRIVHQPSTRSPLSAAVQVGDVYWLSGKLGATAETRAMTEGRVAAETHNIMRSFGALLEELGLDFQDVVRGTVYLADIDTFAEMNQVYAEYFESGAAPSRVTVAVAGLVGGGAIEIAFEAVRTGG